MSYDNGRQTERWAQLIIDQLVKQGVRYFCLSPGSRNTPLLLAVAEHPHVQKMVHFDERGMAFHALGFSKATGIPAVMIVTSGTAVGNLLPAIMEASAAFIPLVVVTADRPPELRDNGANQTTDQVKLFAHHVRWSIDLACPESALSDHYVATSIAQAVYRSSHGNKGPVHINVMLREPFFSNEPLSHTTSFTTRYESAISAPSRSTLESWSAQISGIEKGLIVIGSLQPYVSRKPIYELAETLNWPIFADVTSGCRSDGVHNNRIIYYESILKMRAELKPEAIVHFGDRIVSKPLLEWTSTISPHFYGLIADHSCRHDPKHIVTHRIECSPSTFCSAILPFIPQSSECSWLAKWKECSRIVSEQFDTFFAEQASLTEPGIARWLSSHLTADWALFLSNSMPVRDADHFLFPDQPIGPVFCNRGVSGIDGNIATAIGIAQGIRKPVIAVLGDLAALHDINSLAQLKGAEYPVILLVLNNGGGAIFSFLPIAERKAIFEEYIATAHELNFEHAAKLFSIPYYHSKELDDWEGALSHAMSEKQSCLIEVTTNRLENYHLHLKITEHLKNLCSLTV